MARLWLDATTELLAKPETRRRNQLAWYCLAIALVCAERAGIDIGELKGLIDVAH